MKCLGFKFKDLKKLSKSVENMCGFAEQIRNRVHKDVEKIAQTKTFIGNVSGLLTEMNKRLEESETILNNLKRLLE